MEQSSNVSIPSPSYPSEQWTVDVEQQTVDVSVPQPVEQLTFGGSVSQSVEHIISIPLRPLKHSFSIVSQGDDKVKHWIEEQRAFIIGVALLLVGLAASVAYVAPRGNWQEKNDHHLLGHSILADKYSSAYDLFLTADASSFVASISIIMMLMCGYPFNRKLSIQFFMAFVLMTIIGIVMTYMVYIDVFASLYVRYIGFIMLVWFVLVLVLATQNLIRLIYKAVT